MTTAIATAPLLVRACRREPVDHTPVWFMRQAGRIFPEYRALRERHGILEMAKVPELCAKVTMLPVTRLGVDAAVLYADIMLPLEGMGVPFHLEPDVGPIVERPLRSSEDVGRLRIIRAEEATPYLFDAIRWLRRDLPRGVALIGFAGAPFTLASYLIEGRPTRDFARTKALLFREPETWARLMDTLAEVLSRYLNAQVDAGVDVVQLFDSWAGALSPRDYARAVLPWSRRVFASLRGRGVPRIHFATMSAGVLELMAAADCDVVSVDWRVGLDDAWARIGDRGIQGNLDPATLLGGFAVAADAARDILSRAGGRPGHVFNLGHGVLPETDPDDLARLVELVHAETAR
ncbi:MAG: uroporphyrinogen decarboxylase [Chloroflexi bacterium 13_1_40CM_4_68_4]|nr:MAG: uroporphyrinogen decarboxylase [Chloroflexi bacterium 13_1_40CM_4_68_4]